MNDKERFEKLINCIVTGEEEKAAIDAKELLESGTSAYNIIQQALIPAMSIVSEKYDKKEYFLPQMLLCADSFYSAFSVLKPFIPKEDTTGKGTIVIGVVEGDVHDIGKNLVKTVLEANGYMCVDMGRDVPVEEYIDKVMETKPDYLMLSTLMTPTMANMKRVIEGLVEEGVRNQVKVAIGGGPVSWEFAKKIGADNYSDNEKEAVEWVNSFAKS